MVTVDSPWIPIDYLRVVLVEKRSGGKTFYPRIGEKVDPIDVAINPIIWGQMSDGSHQAFVGGRGWKEVDNAYVFDPENCQSEGRPVGTCIDLFLAETSAPYAPKIGNEKASYAEVALQGLAIDWLCANLCRSSNLTEQGKYVPTGVSSLELPEIRCLSYGKLKLRESNVDQLVLDLLRMGIWSVECYPGNTAGVYGRAERLGQDINLTYKEAGEVIPAIRSRETLCSALSRVVKESFSGRGAEMDLVPAIPEGVVVDVTPNTVLFTPPVRRAAYSDIDAVRAEVGFERLEMLRCLAVLTTAEMVDKQLTYDGRLVSGQPPLVNMDEISPLIQKVRGLPGALQISNGLLVMDPDTWPQRMGAKREREKRRDEMRDRSPVRFRGSLPGAIISEGVGGELTSEERKFLSEGQLTSHLKDRVKKVGV
jgi:hypothetical protein